MDMKRRKHGSYSHNSESEQGLSGEIIELIASSTLETDIVPRVLAAVCRHFRFACGFVYELDHDGVFRLRDSFSGAAPVTILPRSFRLKAGRDIRDISRMLAEPGIFQDADRPAKPNAVLLKPVPGDDGRPAGLVGMTDRRRTILRNRRARGVARTILGLLANCVRTRIYQRRLEQSRQSMASVLDGTGVDIYVTDFDTYDILYVNRSMAAPYGGTERMLGKKCWEALEYDKPGPCEYCPREHLIDDDGNPTKVHSWDYQRPFDGSWFRVLSAAVRWTDGRLAQIISSVDITEKKKYEAAITRMANHDELTGLPNRHKLRGDYEAAVLNAPDAEACLILFDLDKFKPLNDRLGHAAGDELLRLICRTLLEEPLTAGNAYRHGGDEFVLLYHGAGREKINEVVNFLLNRFARPWQLGTATAVCGASVGVAFGRPGGEGLTALLEMADAEMYRAKRNGGGACWADEIRVERKSGGTAALETA